MENKQGNVGGFRCGVAVLLVASFKNIRDKFKRGR